MSNKQLVKSLKRIFSSDYAKIAYAQRISDEMGIPVEEVLDSFMLFEQKKDLLFKVFKEKECQTSN